MSAPRGAGWVLGLIFLVSLPAVTPRIYASDEVQYFAYLRSLWFDGDVDFENEYRAFYDRGIARSEGFRETFLERRTETGRRLNFATLGCALLWSPFYAVADAMVRWPAAAGADRDAAGYDGPYVAAVAYGSAFYGFIAVLLAARVAQRWAGRGWWPAALVWVGTPLLFYMYVAPPMSHACSAFAVTAFVTAWLHVRERWSMGGLAALGALAALMAMVREQDAFFVVGPLLDFARTWLARLAGGAGTPRPGRLLANGLAGAGVAALVYLPQLLAYVALNGYPGPSRLVARKMNWSAPHFLEVLFSPSHGFFVWTPLALLAVAGLIVLVVGRRPGAPADLRWIASCLLAMFALQVYVAGSVESWTVAGAFGQRRFVAVTCLLVVGLAAWPPIATPVRRMAAVLLVALCVWWNIGLIVQFGTGLMDRQRLSPLENAYVSFVVLPRALPSLATRYIFARETFYRSAPDRDDP